MNEIERIVDYDEGEIPMGLHWIYAVKPKGDLNDCLSRIKQIVELIASRSSDQWPTEDEWRNLFPSWLIESFKFYTPEEAEILLTTIPKERWSELPWDFGSWLDAIQDRGWQWWSSKVHESEFEICLSIVEWPASLEAFEHIITAAQADFISKTSLSES